MNTPHPRAFTVDTVPLNQHRITFVSMEGNEYSSKPELCPPDRMDRVADVLDEADLTIMEYFTPELKQTAYSMPVLGQLARKAIAPSSHYDRITELAYRQNQRIGVADIANRPRYVQYDLAFLSAEYGTGVYMVNPHWPGRYFATPTDARRMLTAEAIKQEADRHPDGTHIAYIGAPAHVNRVARYITQELTWIDKARLTTYHDNLPGLDKALRIYEPNGEAWTLAARHDIARRPMGALATLSARISSL